MKTLPTLACLALGATIRGACDSGPSESPVDAGPVDAGAGANDAGPVDAGGQVVDAGTDAGCTVAKTSLSGARITYVQASGIGKIAVRLTTPAAPRYAEGAPLVVNVSTFFTNHAGFYEDLPAHKIGAVHVTHVWPGQKDPSCPRSYGVYQSGGPDDIKALAEVVRFATGETRDLDHCSVTDLFSFTALPDNVGLYAFSHPGIAAINVMADHGERMPNLKYFAGRENPTAT